MSFEGSYLSFEHTIQISFLAGTVAHVAIGFIRLTHWSRQRIFCHGQSVPQRAFGGPTQLLCTVFHMVALFALRRATTYGSPLTKGQFKW